MEDQQREANGGRVTLDYKPRALQQQLHDLMDWYRFGVFICHRRFGKTVCAVNHLIVSNFKIKKIEPRVGYIAPTYKRAKAIAWDYSKRYSSRIPGHKVNESELRIDYPNGGRLRLFGVDYPEALKGIYLDLVVLDEFDEMEEKVFTEVIRPALADRHGKCFMSGTPKGKRNLWKFSQLKGDDWFHKTYRASETKIIDDQELISLHESMSEDEYLQEMECNFSAAIAGAFWRKEMAECRDSGRITDVPHQPQLPVDTFWDLGRGVENTMVVWFAQRVQDEVRFIDHYEISGEGFPHFVKVLSDKGYKYGMHYAPHDIQVHELGTNKTRLEQAAELGLRFTTVPRVQSKADSIEAARKLIKASWFDKTKCAKGLNHLEQYRREWDEVGGVWHSSPLHDVHSNSADAFQQAAMVLDIKPAVLNSGVSGAHSQSWVTKRKAF